MEGDIPVLSALLGLLLGDLLPDFGLGRPYVWSEVWDTWVRHNMYIP